uniref:Uncharacterized protein n=1 Tax=Lactuca sativa TaxID=4236 RepID=A0A9R1WW91_LACSA|nr:hypothetical protein LSAT_V11C900480610 [Lactuca sativa]
MSVLLVYRGRARGDCNAHTILFRIHMISLIFYDVLNLIKIRGTNENLEYDMFGIITMINKNSKSIIPGLNIAIQEACEKFLFHDIRLPKSDSNLSHPFYTDDALFIGDWSQNNLKNLARILWCFHVASALKLTFINRRCFVLVSPRGNWLVMLGYLGVM